MKPLKIAQVSATFPPYLAGTGNVCYHNARELVRLGHQVTVFTSRFPDVDFTYPDGLCVERYRPPIRLGNAPLIPQLLKLSGFDLVHLHYPFFFGAEMVALRCRALKMPYVITYHQDVLFRGPLRSAEWVHRNLIGRRILAGAARLLVTSRDYHTQSYLQRLIVQQAHKVVELPNGIDTDRFHPAPPCPDLAARYGIRPNDRVVLFVGALDRAHYFKGVNVLLRSLALLSNPRLRLLIVGDGDLRRTYQEEANQLGLNENAIFCGRVPDEDLPAHYRLCDLLVLPSITRGEAFGIVLLEAFATGKPVIASNLPGVRTVVDDGVNGLLTRPNDTDDLASKVRYLLANPDIRQRFGRNGRKKAEETYAWHIIGRRLESIYYEALQWESH